MKNHAVRSPHGTRVDEYYWLRDDTREVREHLASWRVSSRSQ